MVRLLRAGRGALAARHSGGRDASAPRRAPDAIVVMLLLSAACSDPDPPAREDTIDWSDIWGTTDTSTDTGDDTVIEDTADDLADSEIDERDADDDADADADGSGSADSAPEDDNVILAGACMTQPNQEALEGGGALPYWMAVRCAPCLDRGLPLRCASRCIEALGTFSTDCATCAADELLCMGAYCPDVCDLTAGGSPSEDCTNCVAASCESDFLVCAGIADEEPEMCEAPEVVANLENGFAAEQFAEACLPGCLGVSDVAACISPCVNRAGLVDPECSVCFGAYAECLLGCEACGDDPFGWECSQCGGPECVAALRECTGAEVSVPEPAAPGGTVNFINACANEPMATLVLSPDGAPLIRRVPYGSIGGPAELAAGTHTFVLTGGIVGDVGAGVAAKQGLVTPSSPLNAVALANGFGSCSLWMVPRESTTPDAAEFWLANGSPTRPAWVFYYGDDDEGTTVRVPEPVTVAIPPGPATWSLDSTGDLEPDLQVPDTSGVTWDVGDAVAWVLVDLPHAPTGVQFLITYANGDPGIAVPSSVIP